MPSRNSKTEAPKVVELGTSKKVESADGYSLDAVVKAEEDLNIIPKTKQDRKNAAADITGNSSEIKSVTSMFEELVNVFKDVKEWSSLYDLKKEYKQIAWNIMNAYNPAIEKITNGDVEDNGNIKVENKDVDNINVQSLPDSPEARNVSANEILARQPEESDKQISDMQTVFDNWTPEQKQIIYWILNREDISSQIKELYNKVNPQENPQKTPQESSQEKKAD